MRHGGRRLSRRSFWALVLSGVLLLTLTDSGISPLTGSPGSHPAHRAPGQRWSSAAGSDHLAGSAANRTVPQSLRGRYPLRKPAAKPRPPANPARVETAPAAQVTGFDPATSVEVASGRSARERTFGNADGTQTTEFSSDPVNYQRKDGGWAPIDSRLVRSGSGWRNAADSVDARLAPYADSPDLVSVRLDGDHAVGFGLADATHAAAAVDGSSAVYAAVRPDADLRLTAVGGGVKETIVLRSPDAPQTYLFPLRLTGLTAKATGGRVVLADAKGHQRAEIPAGYLADSAAGPGGPAVSTGVHYQVVTSGGRQALEVKLDAGWLRDPARRYPVTVDPSVETAGADGSMDVRGGSSTANPSELVVGNNGSAAAAYLKFDGLASRLRFHTIFGVQLQVLDFDSASCAPRPVSVHKVTQAWTPGTGFSYPGPAVDPTPLASSSFAYGHIALGQSASACPSRQALFNLGAAGRDLVQGWVNGQPDNGLSLRASDSDTQGWKKFAGGGTANPPSLFVTHSAYNASYAIPDPVPNPPVLQNQDGTVKIAVRNLSAETWTPAGYSLIYRAYRADTHAAVTQQRAASLPGNVARNARVTLTATIKRLPPGKYILDFTMAHTGGPVFTDEQVPPARIVLQVFDLAPVPQELQPPNGYQSPTLTPQLWARAVDIDAPPGSTLRFGFQICEGDGSGDGAHCVASGDQTSQAWTVPAGALSWSKTYQWRAVVKDASNTVYTPWSVLLAWVPQPALTSRVAGAPYGSPDREFDPQVGNFSTTAVDATVAGIGPRLAVVRTYNSLDARHDLAFGAGWVTQYDMRLVQDLDGSGNVVVTYPDGQQVRFGLNPDGGYAAPQGRLASLTLANGLYTLADRTGQSYQFSGTGKLVKITDAGQRSIVLTYNLTDGKLAKATASVGQSGTSGRALGFTWSGSHVASVSTDPVTPGGSPLTWTYTYSGDLLTKVCAPGAACTGYSYTGGSHYRGAVMDSGPDAYYRLGEPDGADAGSEVAVNLGKDAGAYSDVTLGTAGSLAGTDDTAATFNGGASVVDLPKGELKANRDAAVEAWFKVSASQGGGPILGYQDRALTGTPTAGVPVLYVGTDGWLRGQFSTGTAGPISSQSRVNDNQWHHVVLSAMGSTQTLYLDGSLVGELDGTTIDNSNLTFNQIGAAYATPAASWPKWGDTAKRSFSGTIDDVALYAHPLGAAAVADHYARGTHAADLLTKVTLPSGKVAASVTYDNQLDRVAEYTDGNGGTWKIRAPGVSGGDNDLRRTVEVRDPADRSYLYEYDALAGRLLREGAPAGLGVRAEDRPQQPTPSPTPSPTQTCTRPDPGDPSFCLTVPGDAGDPVFVVHPTEGMAVRSISYGDLGLPTVVTNEVGDAVTFGYDTSGHLTTRQSCRAANTCDTEYFTYPSGQANPLDPLQYLPIEVRDPRSTGVTDNRFRTSYTYASTGDLATQANPDGGQTTNRYTIGTEAAVGGGTVPPALLATSTDPRNAVTSYRYFANGDLAQVTEPSGLVTKYAYDGLGRVTSRTEVSDSFPAGVVTGYTYDGQSHLAGTTGPSSTDAVTGARHQSQTTTGFDSDGNPARIEAKDLLGGDQPRVTTIDYDDHDRPERVTDPEGGETSYGYDRFGNRTFTVDTDGNRFEYAYTTRNALAEVRLRHWTGDPDGAGDPGPGDYLVLDSYAYDFAGRLASHTDAMGRRLNYAYYSDDLLATVTLKGFHDRDGSTRDLVVESDAYDAAGHLARQVTGGGKTVTDYTTNPAGQVDTVTADPTGLARRTTFGYDRAGNVTRVARSGAASNVTWPMPATGETVDNTYDLAGNLTKETVSGGGLSQATVHGYDQRGLEVSTTDPRGQVTGADPAAYTSTARYDELGRPVSRTGPAVATETAGGPAQTVHLATVVGYDTFGDPVARRDELGNVTSTAYDKLGRAVTVTLPRYTPPGGSSALTPTSHLRYDGLGNLTEVVDPRGHSTRYGYDQLSRLRFVDAPARDDSERAQWHLDYTRTGELLAETDPTGAKVTATYDDLRRQVSNTQVERRPVADNFTTTYSYDDAGNMTGAQAPSGAGDVMAYDAVGELVKRTDPSGVAERYGYDLDGRQVRDSDAAGRTVRTDYDGLGRQAGVTDLAPNGTTLRTMTYGYDAAGDLVTATDPLRNTTTYAYDAADRLVRQVEPVTDTTSITTTFGYDAAGNRTRLTDGRGNATITTVNSLGLPESVVEPSTPAYPGAADRTWTASYDAAGEAVRLAEPGGVTRQRTFDAGGRLTAETASGGQAAGASRTMGYDLADRLTTVSAPGGDDTYGYDDRSLPLSADGPSGRASFDYNADGQVTTRTDAAGTARYGYVKGRLSTLTDGVTGGTQTLGYDAAGLLATVDYGSGRIRTFGRDDLGRVASDTLANSAGTTVASTGYGYDDADRLVRKLTTGTAGAGESTYGYDDAGRLTSWTAGGRTTPYTWDSSGNRTQAGDRTASYDARDRLLSDGDATFTYTARGTLASRTATAGAETYAFDAFDQLVQQAGTAYRYDGLGRLAARGGATFSYAGTGADVVSDGTERYARGPGGELLGLSHGQDNRASRVALDDLHGDVVGGFDPADTSLAGLDDTRTYDPFGQVTAHSGTPAALGYQGGWTDPQSGQVDFGARWYDPRAGAFASPDPAGYSTGPSILANGYTYAAGAPTDYVDLDGRAPTALAGGGGEDPRCRTFGGTPPPVCDGVGGGLGGWAPPAPAPPAGNLLPPPPSGPGPGGHGSGGGGNGSGSGGSGGGGGGTAAGRAEAARQAALARARAITDQARNAAAWAAEHKPRPPLPGATSPRYGSGSKPPVSSSPRVPASKVGPSRDVVKDQAKASTSIYDRVVDETGPVLRDMPRAAQQAAAPPASGPCSARVSTTGIPLAPLSSGGASAIPLAPAGGAPVSICDAPAGDPVDSVPDPRDTSGLNAASLYAQIADTVVGAAVTAAEVEERWAKFLTETRQLFMRRAAILGIPFRAVVRVTLHDHWLVQGLAKLGDIPAVRIASRALPGIGFALTAGSYLAGGDNLRTALGKSAIETTASVAGEDAGVVACGVVTPWAPVCGAAASVAAGEFARRVINPWIFGHDGTWSKDLGPGW